MNEKKSARKHETPRRELLFRLWFSLFGIGMIGVVIAVQGMPRGAALFEVFGIVGAFFGGTAVWALYRLYRRK